MSSVQDSSLVLRIVRGILWATSAKVLGLGAGLISSALLARLLTTAEMGTYFLILSLTAFAGVCARFGMQQTLVRLVAESIARGQPGRAQATLKRVLVVVILGSATVGGAIGFGGGEWVANTVFHNPLMAGVVGLSALWVIALALNPPVSETFRGLHEVRTASFLSISAPSTLLALMLIGVWWLEVPLTLARAIGLAAAASGLTFLIGGLMLLPHLPRLRGPGTISMGELLAISAPVFVINVGNIAINSGSLWIGGVFLAPADIALYGVAMKLVLLVSVPMTLVVAVVQPVIAQLNTEGDKPRLQHALRATATLSALPALGVLGVYLFFGQPFLGTVFGEEYRAAYPILLVLVLAQVLFMWAGPCNNVLTMTGHQRQAMVLVLASGVLTAVLCVISVQVWGAMGLAIAVAAGDITKNLLAWWLAHRLTGIWTHVMLRPSELKATVVPMIAMVRERRARKTSKAAADENDEVDGAG